MEQNKLKGYEAKLNEERKKLMAEVGRDEQVPDFGHDTEDPAEKTDRSEAFGNQLAMAGDLKDRLAEIDIALSKIKEGTYGTCEKCGKEIEPEILDIDPESRFCKECKIV